jgi:hypothetical protein
MKIRYRLAAFLSAAALTGVAGLASAGTASATSSAPTPEEWCAGVPAELSCLYSEGSGNALSLAAPGRSTNFLSENGEQTDGHDYVMYYQDGTKACLTDSGAVGYLETCSTSDSRQRWYYDGSDDELINLYATNHYGHNDCLALNSVPNGVIIESCSIGGWAQNFVQ